MKSRYLSTLATGLFSFVLVFMMTGCEPDLQFSAENITAQAKNAVDILPANPAFVGMMNTQDLKSNAHTDIFGSSGLMQEEMPQEALSQFRDFVEMTGFDPEEDLNEVYVSIEQVSNGDHPTASIVAYASIDPASLQAFVDERIGDELQHRTYRGIDVYEGKDDDHAPNFSFVNDEMMIAASSPSALEAMIDRLKGEGTALSTNSTMMDLIARASTGKSGWLVAKKPTDTPFSKTSADNDLEDTARQIWGALDYVVGAMNVESSGLDSRVFLYPGADVSAEDLSSLTKGMVAVLKADPELDDEKLAMLDDIRITSSSDHVQIQMFVDNDLMEIMKQH